MSKVSAGKALAETLHAAKERILVAWEERVRAEIAAARLQDSFALRDHLPVFLTRLGDALDPQVPLDNAADKSKIAEIHGKERAVLLLYTLPQVLHEYSILRFFVFEALEARTAVDTANRDIILNSFDSATRHAAEAFVDERTERERETRRRVERERDRTQSQLHELKADNDLQKTFVATLSHDLRNPIGAVQMALELLLLEIPSTPDVRSLSEMMSRNLAHAESMLLDLLDANRLKAGHPLPIVVEACDLSHLTKALLAELHAMRGQGFILRMNDDVRGFWSAARLRRVISNLLDNAVKHGAVNGPITLSIAQDAALTTIAVHNEGHPIPTEAQATIFEPHFQADGPDGRHGNGWGLGLTLVRAVAEAHGGRVRVDSGLATGTTFTVTIPNDARPKPA